MSRQPTAKIACSNLLNEDKLYVQRAKITLPLLVRQAEAGQTIFYSELADEIGIPNPRNLNYILGAIGNALMTLGKKTKNKIPPIQCLVINKYTHLPGEGVGWFIDKNRFKKLSRNKKREILNKVLADIFSFPHWDLVLKQLQLEKAKINITNSLIKARTIQRNGGGESPQHLAFKNFIASNPHLIGLPNDTPNGQKEYSFPSSDSIDVLFRYSEQIIGVEVKSKISDEADILRGIFQCVKYKALIEAEQKINNQTPNCKVVLALEGLLPKEFTATKNLLGVEIIEKIKIDSC